MSNRTKKVVKWTGIGIGVVALTGAGITAFAVIRPPKRNPPTTERFDYTPERIARGKYLVENLADCFTCHGEHHEELWGRPVREDAKGQGGFPFDEKYHVPGLVQAQNITPDAETGLGNWTDGEIIRAVREGIGRDGRALFPMMPYEFFKHMSDEDARSTVAYLRQLKPIKHVAQPRRLNWAWENIIVKTIPEPVTKPIETPQDTKPESWEPRDVATNPAWKQHLDYGDYLVTVAGCVECHTPHDESGRRIKGMDFAGGYLLKGPWGSNTSANITGHKDAYVGKVTKEQFVNRFKSFASLDVASLPKIEPGKNTFMPWLSFKDLTEQDLGAIYDFLKYRVKPIENHVDLAGVYQEPPPKTSEATPPARL